MNEENVVSEPNYSIHVFEDHAIIQGFLTSDVLTILIRLCRQEGFTHLVPFDDGFKLVKQCVMRYTLENGTMRT